MEIDVRRDVSVTDTAKTRSWISEYSRDSPSNQCRVVLLLQLRRSCWFVCFEDGANFLPGNQLYFLQCIWRKVLS